MEDLTQVYRDALLGRIEALEGARAARAERALESVATIRRIAHSLRGSGGTFGFPEVSAAAAALEDASESNFEAALDALLQVLGGVARGAPKGARLLLVHADSTVSARLRDVVTPLADEVAVAATGARARELISQGDIGLVVLGLSLPDGDGRKLLSELRAQAATQEVPVLLVGAGVDAHQKAECFRMGADAFFDEPVDGELVAAVVSARLRRAPRPQGAPTASRPAETRAAGDILLLEDDPMVASILKHRLDREGFRVLHFTDGVQALAAVEGTRLALAILDIKVPGMDGFELLARLRRSPEAARVPVMMLTAMGAEQDVVRGLGLGADDYIVKPFSLAEVMARVHRLLQRK
jgi:DNA-binding response OmpR family regulator